MHISILLVPFTFLRTAHWLPHHRTPVPAVLLNELKLQETSARGQSQGYFEPLNPPQGQNQLQLTAEYTVVSPQSSLLTLLFCFFMIHVSSTCCHSEHRWLLWVDVCWSLSSYMLRFFCRCFCAVWVRKHHNSEERLSSTSATGITKETDGVIETLGNGRTHASADLSSCLSFLSLSFPPLSLATCLRFGKFAAALLCRYALLTLTAAGWRCLSQAMRAEFMDIKSLEKLRRRTRLKSKRQGSFVWLCLEEDSCHTWNIMKHSFARANQHARCSWFPVLYCKRDLWVASSWQWPDSEVATDSNRRIEPYFIIKLYKTDST